ncbi:MAG: hypothetical protein R3Y35_15265 [Clostridia bacterium]
MERKIKTSISMDESLNKQIDLTCESYGYKSKNQFMVEAIKNHIANVTLEKSDDVFTEKLKDVLEKHTRSLGKRVSTGLYRYAVDITMIMYILALQSNLNADNIDYLRGLALNDVKKLKGKISLESIAEFYTDKEERYKDERIGEEWDD